MIWSKPTCLRGHVQVNGRYGDFSPQTARRRLRLLYENRLGEEDLRGLREEKMKSIRSFAQFLKDGAA